MADGADEEANGLRTSGRSQVSSSLWREAPDQLEEKGDSQVPNVMATGHLDRQVKKHTSSVDESDKTKATGLSR